MSRDCAPGTHFLPQQEGAAAGAGRPPQQPPPAAPSAGVGLHAAAPSPPASQPTQPARRLLSMPLQQQHLPLPAPQVPWAAALPPRSSSSSSLLSPQQAHLEAGRHACGAA